MEKNSDGNWTIQWMTGVSRVSRETKIDGRDMVFGYRINGGDFTETSRLRFATESDLRDAKPLLAEARL